MSVSRTAGFLGTGEEYLHNIRILRYAIGTAIAVFIAQTVAWDLAYMMPVLALGMLASPAPRPTLKVGIAFVLIVSVACLTGYLIGRLFLPYPLVFILFIGLLLLRLFYAKAGGASPALITFMLISVLLIPAIMMQSYGLGAMVALAIVTSAVATILIVWLVYGIFPDPPEIDPAPAPAAAGVAPPEPRERLRSALTTTAVVFPVAVAFFVFEKLESAIVIIFLSMLSMQPGFAKDFKAGAALLLGNLAGGVVAIIFYELLVIAPDLSLMIALTTLVGLVCGRQVFSGKRTGALWGTAFSTVLLIVGSITASTGDAGAKVYTRITQIMVAVLYVVFAFGFLERWRKASRA